MTNVKIQMPNEFQPAKEPAGKRTNAKTNNHETTKLRKHEIGKAFGRRLTGYTRYI
jgi:hypothetical protein